VKDVVVASRYAKALFIVTEKRGETERALPDLQGVAAAIAPDTAAGRRLHAPLVLLADKRRALTTVFEGKVLRSVVLFIDLLLRKKRLTELPTIVVEYEALVERKQGVRRAQVVSAVALTDAEVSRLHAALEQRTGGKVRLATAIDQRLLGGAYVRIGDRVIDRSVSTLLRSIRETLQNANV
jgi:F-type H+-transporting ATPase subunit delta